MDSVDCNCCILHTWWKKKQYLIALSNGKIISLLNRLAELKRKHRPKPQNCCFLNHSPAEPHIKFSDSYVLHKNQVWNVGRPALVYLSSQIWSGAVPPFPGTMGKDKSWLSWLLTGEINHCAHRRIAFQAASWELHYPAPASYYYAYRLWLVLGSDRPQPTSVSLGGAGDQSSATCS